MQFVRLAQSRRSRFTIASRMLTRTQQKLKTLLSIWCAINRLSRSGKVIGENQTIFVFKAMKAVPIEGTYAYFEENPNTSIKPCKRADWVILGKSPFEANRWQSRNRRVADN